MINGLNTVSALSLARGLGASALESASGSSAAGGTAAQVDAAGASFGATVARAAADVAGNLHHAETVSIQGIKGQATTREVVDAVMTAQQSLQTALAIRDKIVSAYLEISRMTI